MKLHISIVGVVVGVLTLVACGNQKNQRIPIRRTAATAQSQSNKMAFTHANGGCLSLTAVVDYYTKTEAAKLARLSVRDIAIDDKEQSPKVLPNLLKARPLAIEVDTAANIIHYLPIQFVKQNDCSTVEFKDESGKIQTFQILKAEQLRSRSTRSRPSNRIRPVPNPRAVKQLPGQTAVQQQVRSEYSPTSLALLAPNGEKWIFQVNMVTKNLIIRVYTTLTDVKSCAKLNNVRIQEVYDLVLLSDKPEKVRVSDDVLTAVKTLGLTVPVTAAPLTKGKQKAANQTTSSRANPNSVNDKTYQQLNSDFYAFLAQQLLSDKIVAPGCDK